MTHREICDAAILVGYDPEGGCVYSSAMPLERYWDGEHPWDDDSQVRSLRLAKVRGYLFDSQGELLQEFETVFNSVSGLYQSGWARHSDGTYREHAA